MKLVWIALFSAVTQTVFSRKGKCSTGRSSVPFLPSVFTASVWFRHLLRDASINIYLFFWKEVLGHWYFFSIWHPPNTEASCKWTLGVMLPQPSVSCLLPVFAGSTVNLDIFVKQRTTITFCTNILLSLESIKSYCMWLSEASVFLWFLREVGTEVTWISRLFPRSVCATIQINRI